MSDEDEIELKIAVVDYFIYTLEHTIREYQQWSFKDKAITFPCFGEATLLLQMIETDEDYNDFTQVLVDC
jgi:hypothetical protein